MEKAAKTGDSGAQGTPRIAVIVPAYGVARFLGEALQSLQAQTFRDWECVVIDDGAPDDVAGAVAPFLADQRIRFLATDNKGVSAARNRAIAATSAPLVCLLDGDDLFRPHYLATMVPLIEGDPAIRLASCNARIFGAVPRERICFNRKQGTGDGKRCSLADTLDRSFGIYIGTTFRRADFDAVGGFDEAMAHSEDFDFWVRLMLLGGDGYYVDDVMGDYRVRAGSASGDTIRLLQGNIRIYEKALAALPAGRSERALIERLLGEQRAQLHFEQAIDRVILGDTRSGLAALRTSGSRGGSSAWTLSLHLWRLFPALARPMLRWRRQAHSRGAAQTGLLASLSAMLG